MRILQKARYLRELAEEYDLHGLYFQHVALCRRRAWLHLAGATHAVHHSRVQRGLALHQTEKRTEEVPKGLGIAPDAIVSTSCSFLFVPTKRLAATRFAERSL